VYDNACRSWTVNEQRVYTNTDIIIRADTDAWTVVARAKVILFIVCNTSRSIVDESVPPWPISPSGSAVRFFALRANDTRRDFIFVSSSVLHRSACSVHVRLRRTGIRYTIAFDRVYMVPVLRIRGAKTTVFVYVPFTIRWHRLSQYWTSEYTLSRNSFTA